MLGVIIFYFNLETLESFFLEKLPPDAEVLKYLKDEYAKAKRQAGQADHSHR